jgi:hypothetical protein
MVGILCVYPQLGYQQKYAIRTLYIEFSSIYVMDRKEIISYCKTILRVRHPKLSAQILILRITV